MGTVFGTVFGTSQSGAAREKLAMGCELQMGHELRMGCEPEVGLAALIHSPFPRKITQACAE